MTKDLIAIKGNMGLKKGMRQTKIYFWSQLLGLQVLKKNRARKGEEGKKRKKKEKKWEKTKKVCFHFGIMCILDV